MIDPNTRKRLLELARKAVQAEVRGGPAPDLTAYADIEVPHSGAFVTLHKDGHLRGCIGTFRPLGTIAQTIAEMGRSAVHDPRFVVMPLRAADLPDVQIEISVLGPLEPTDDPLSLETGRHGIYVRRGYAGGCFLPQVATEQGWDAETFLTECCRGKAGLAPDAWKQPGTEVSLFTAEVFGEADPDAGRD